MQKEIVTTGQLRRLLATVIVEVKDGEIDLDRAGRIAKLAAQINESYYSEIKAHVIAKSLGVETIKMGEMPIDSIGSDATHE